MVDASPMSNALFSLAKNIAKAINIRPITSEPTESKKLLPVTAVNIRAIVATTIPLNAAVSSISTVITAASLVSFNSLIKVEKLNFSPLSFITFLKERKAILKAYASNTKDIPRITKFMPILSI